MDVNWDTDSSGADMPTPRWTQPPSVHSGRWSSGNLSGVDIPEPQEERTEVDGTNVWLKAFEYIDFGKDELDQILGDAVDDIDDPEFDVDVGLEMLVELGFVGDETEESTESYSFEIPPAPEIPADQSSSSSRSDRFWTGPSSSGLKEAFVRNKKVYVKIEDEEFEIGKSTMRDNARFTFGRENVYRLANLVNEEGAIHGVGQGFSMFFHCAACLAVGNQTSDVLEPEGGCDVARDGLLFEITGMGWRSRISKANFVLNKYAILDLTSSHEPYHTEYRQLSLMEDRQDPNIYKGSAYDQGDSEYTAAIERIARARVQLRPRQLVALELQCQRWVFEHKDVMNAKPVLHELNASKVDNIIRDGSKERSGAKYYHSPFRVLPPQTRRRQPRWTADPSIDVGSDLTKTLHDSSARKVNVDDPYYDRAKVEVKALMGCYEIDTTFHTCSAESTPLDIYSRPRGHCIETERYGTSVAFDYHFVFAMGFPSFQYAYVQSELLPKIQGKAGYFYSKHTQTGISWNRSAAKSLVWRCVYYQFNEPEDESVVGRWVRSGDVWRSPTFIVSRNDIQFASVLPYRMVATLTSASTLLGLHKLRTVAAKLMTWLATLNDSSWRTTELCADSRFLTTVWLSRKRNVQEIIDNQVCDRREIRHCDHLYLRLLQQFIRNNGSYSRRLTPLLQLPLALASIEKDWPLAMQWHIRETSHGLQCMAKIIKAHKLEKEVRAEHVAWYERQAEFLESIPGNGARASDIDDLFAGAPEVPALNAVLYIGMSHATAGDLKALGARSGTSGFSMSGMISDRNCTVVKENERGFESKPRKIADCLADLVESDENLSGAYELVVKRMGGPLVKNIFTMHAKDQKSGEREIAQMHFDMRPTQFLAESMSKMYCDVTDADMMTDPEKYSKVVASFMDMLGREGVKSVLASEDRTFFCGYLLPEAMGLAVFINALDAGSSALISTAGIMMRNTRRFVIFPTEFGTRTKEKSDEIRQLTDGATVFPAFKFVGKKVVKTLAMEMRTHMMQGIFAHTAAVVNTTFVKAMAKFQSRCMPGMMEHQEFTTSDDVGRGATFEAGTKGLSHAANDFCERPASLLHHCMMKNSERKFMVADNLIEFNNVLVTKSGMVPQGPIHCHMAIQPLNSLSPLLDAISASSSAVQTLAWGDSPDMAMSCVAGAKEVYKQKWLPSQTGRGLVDFTDFFPSCIEDAVIGFKIDDDDRLNAMLHMTKDEDIEAVLRNEASIITTVSKIAIKPQHVKKLRKVKRLAGLPTFSRRLASAVSARRNANRVNPRYAQPLPVAKRKQTMERFATKMLEERTPHPMLEEVAALFRTPRIQLSRTWLKKSTRRPTKLGNSTREHSKLANQLRLWEYAKVQYGLPFDQDSIKIPEPTGEQTRSDCVAKVLAKLEKDDEVVGKSFKAPGGLPLYQFHDNQLLLRPRAFNFQFILPQKDRAPTAFHHNGSRIDGFKYCKWGGNSIAAAYRNNAGLAFGYRRMQIGCEVFYANPDRTVRRIHMRPQHNMSIVPDPHRPRRMIAAIFSEDLSPLDPADLGVEARGCMAGTTGDEVAMLNFGSYLFSSHDAAFATMRRVFAAMGSSLPLSMQHHARPYPWFPQGSAVVPTGFNTMFIGHACSRRVRFLDKQEDEYLVVRVDMTGDVARYTTVELPRKKPSDTPEELDFDVDLGGGSAEPDTSSERSLIGNASEGQYR